MNTNLLEIVDVEPPYVKLYIEDISNLCNIPNSAKSLIYCLLKRMDYEGIIGLNKAYKDIICKEIGISDKTFRNNMTELVKVGILKILGKGLYEMNPQLFARGGWKEIQKRRENFRLVIDYTYEGERSISAHTVTE